MSVRKLTASLLTTLVLFSGLSQVGAQEHFPADPFEFDPDFNWFEPVTNMDLADMKPSKRAAYGWFATYDRLMLWGSRPEKNPPAQRDSELRLDRGWGHRYHVGYMVPTVDQGWSFTWTEYEVGAGVTARRERANRYNGGQVLNGQGGAGANSPFFPFASTPPGEANNRGWSYRFIDERLQTYNLLSYDSYELNKTWRMEPYHYGGILEPLVGVRWMRVEDRDIEDDVSFPLPGVGDPPGTFVEQVQIDTETVKNDMIGGQVGFHYTKFRDRFIYGADLRVFFGGSYQSSSADRRIQQTFYGSGPGGGTGVPPVFIIADDDPNPAILDSNEEFFVGFDARGELGYQLTSQLSARVGFQCIDIARGVWRGGQGVFLSGGDQDQDVVLVGATFGVNLNY